MSRFLLIVLSSLAAPAFSFNIQLEDKDVSPQDQQQARVLREQTTAPMSLVGKFSKEMFTCEGECKPAGNQSCYKLKNDALKAYCLQGETACSEFGYSSNRNKYGIPRWVEDFCRHNHSIPDKVLDNYYRSGYTAHFKDSKVYDSAMKYATDQSARKRWIIHYVNGYLLKPY